MSLKHDNFRFYWAVVTEKTFNQCLCKGISPTILQEFLTINRLFLR